MPKTQRRLITIAHSYCVALNRRLAHELAREGGDGWDVTAVAPSFFHSDLRPLALEPFGGPGPEPCRLEAVPVYFSKRVPFMLYGRRLRELLRSNWDVVHGWEEPYVLSGGQIANWSPRSAAYVFYTFQNLPKRYPPPFSMIERSTASTGNTPSVTPGTRPPARRTGRVRSRCSARSAAMASRLPTTGT